MHRSICAGALVALAGLSLVSTATASAKPVKRQPVDLAFSAVAGNRPVTCGSPITGLGSTARTAVLSDLRFYATDVKLITRSGRAVPVKLDRDSAFQVTRKSGSVTLIDLENAKGACAAEGTPATNAHVRGTVPAGQYVGARWTVGVPFALNHSDLTSAPAPLNLAAMGWSWQVGRKFLKIELTDPTATPAAPMAMRQMDMPMEPTAGPSSTFLAHVGSTGCTGNPAAGASVKCTTPNEANIRLNKFNAKTQRVAVDVGALVAGQDVFYNHGDAPGCMSGPTDPECGGVFRSLGIGWNADGNGNGISPSNPQTLFRAIQR